MKKRTKIIMISVLSIIVVFAGGFFLYVSDYYKADNFAVQTMKSIKIKTDGNLTILSPTIPSGKGIIFYPGAKVEETAYLPLLEKLPEIQQGYIAGHSLGGAMASSYVSKHQDKIDGLILLSAYIYGDISVDKAVMIYGSEDTVLDKSKIDYTENVLVIEGGNHAQFGNYGMQKGDGSAAITADEQQEIAVEVNK